MSNIDNLKKIIDQIQAELNIDAKDNWDLKQVIVDSLYKLDSALRKEITVMQCEIYRAEFQDIIDRFRFQDESALVDTKESTEAA